MENFNETLAKLRDIRKELVLTGRTLETNKEKEILESTKIIEDKYKQEIQKVTADVEKTESDIEELEAKIIFYSYFDYRSIVKIMRDIIRVYEGENFIYKEIKYCPYPEKRIKQERAKILISSKKDNFIKDDIDISKLYSIQKSGDGIVLEWNDTFFPNSHIKFYNVTEDGEVKTNIKLSKFPYLKQFINFVISFCIENNLKRDLPLYELEKLKQEFIRNNVGEIEKYHEMIKLSEENKMQEEIKQNAEYRNKQLQKALNKKI